MSGYEVDFLDNPSHRIEVRMSKNGKARDRRFRIQNESLETRTVPTTFGIAWPNASQMTVSFAGDSSSIGNGSNNLSTAMNSQFSAAGLSVGDAGAAWQGALLKAFQAWSSRSNINFGVVADNGAGFGTAGQLTGDSRFGDVRIGGMALTPDALAISSPFDPGLAGTSSGDIVLNTSYDFGSHYDELLNVALHEVGHVLGFADSNNPSSVLSNTINLRTSLSDSDIAQLQALYGTRPADAFDAEHSNNTAGSASELNQYCISNGAIPQVAFGDITTSSDVDFYSFQAPSGYSGQATVQLQTGGVSLLNARVTLLDTRGNTLGQQTITQLGGGSARVQLGNITPGGKYLIKVESLGDSSSFNVGRYGLAMILDQNVRLNSSQITTFLQGDYNQLSAGDIKQLLRDMVTSGNTGDGYSGISSNTNELAATYQATSTTSFEAGNRLVAGTQVDRFRLDLNNAQGSVLTVHVVSTGANAVNPNVRLTHSNGTVIASTILANDNNQITIQATGLNSVEDVRILVSSQDGTTGEYHLEAFVSNQASNALTFIAGQLGAGSTADNFRFYVAEPQQFQMLAAGNSLSSNKNYQLRFSIINAWGNAVWQQTTGDGQPTSGSPLLLNTGEYRVRVELLGSGTLPDAVNYSLSGDTISDPIGPVSVDGTLVPQYTDPTMPGYFTYPGGNLLMTPYYFDTILDPFYNPYASTSNGNWIA